MKRKQDSTQRCWNSVSFCHNKYFPDILLKNTDLLFYLEKRSFLLVTKLQRWITTYWPHSVCWFRLEGAQEARRGHFQNSWPQLTNGIFQTIKHHSAIKPGRRLLRGKYCSGTGWASVGWWWPIVLICFTCWIVFLPVIFLFIILLYYYFYFNFISIMKQFVSKPMRFLKLFQFFQGCSEWAAVWCSLARWG